MTTIEVNPGDASSVLDNGRVPAFVGLARFHGGVYTEDQDGMTVAEALHRANMDYDVQSHEGLNVPVLGLGGVTTVDLPDHRATVRVNKDGSVAPVGFGVVRSRYSTVSPREALTGLGEQILDDFGANVVAVGEYGKPTGSRFYAAFQLPSHIEIGSDRTDLFLTLLGGHDGGTALQAMLAPIRFYCTNQTTATFGKATQKITVRHTGTPMVRAAEARRILGMVNTWTEAFKQIAEGMLTAKVTNDEFEKIVKAEFLPEEPGPLAGKRSINGYARKLESLNALYRGADTQDYGRGTAYAAYNAVVEWADHFKPVRGGDERRFARTLDGELDSLKSRAFEVFASV